VTSEPAFYVGLLLVLTGVACVAAAAFLRRHSLGRHLTLVAAGSIPFLAAGALLLYLARERHRFRVTDVVLEAITDYAGPCPGQHRLAVRVETVGGAGAVTFRVWADEDFDAPLRSVRVRRNTSFELVVPVTVRRSGLSTAFGAVEAPNVMVGSESFRVRCSDVP